MSTTTIKADGTGYADYIACMVEGETWSARGKATDRAPATVRRNAEGIHARVTQGATLDTGEGIPAPRFYADGLPAPASGGTTTTGGKGVTKVDREGIANAMLPGAGLVIRNALKVEEEAANLRRKADAVEASAVGVWAILTAGGFDREEFSRRVADAEADAALNAPTTEGEGEAPSTTEGEGEGEASPEEAPAS